MSSGMNLTIAQDMRDGAEKAVALANSDGGRR
jgi:hypothetical protein